MEPFGGEVISYSECAQLDICLADEEVVCGYVASAVIPGLESSREGVDDVGVLYVSALAVADDRGTMNARRSLYMVLMPFPVNPMRFFVRENMCPP